MTEQAVVAAVDWGTSRLRIWLLDASGRSVAEHRSDEGMATLSPADYPAVLDHHLSKLGAGPDLPAIVCGMAGSRQGWIEARYVDVPTALDAIASATVAAPGTARIVHIVPGLAQRDPARPDVMRGEETQLAGIAALARGHHTVCMPGTHCKWVEAQDGIVAGFRTFMTGELYAVLAGHSILRHAVSGASSAVAPDDPDFRDWLARGLDDPAALASRLFSVRASTLLTDFPPARAAAALSGLVIGTEIGAALASARPASLILLGSGSLGALYAAGFARLGQPFTTFDADDAARAGLFAVARRTVLAYREARP